MANADGIRVLSASVVDEVRRYPTVELIRRLFPDVKMRGRSVMCNPLRGEKHASLSCFRSRSGEQRWKDHATGESGDNIDFFRLANPGLGYVDAVDALSRLVLGRSAFEDELAAKTYRAVTLRKAVSRPDGSESPSAIRVAEVLPLGGAEAGVPAGVTAYIRERGISDDVSGRYFCCATYVNGNRAGRATVDPVSGLPIVGKDGEIVRDDGRHVAVAMMNDIGGYAFRTPDTPEAKGLKCTDSAFPTTLLSGGRRPLRSVVVQGAERNCIAVDRLYYDGAAGMLRVNGTGGGFGNLSPWAAAFGVVFLSPWMGRYLEGKDFRGAVAVMDCLNGPVNRRVTVVEGMFDGVSVIELERMGGHGVAPGSDLVILNSVSNIRWAVPFLSMHGEVSSLLDNDMRTCAGQKAFDVLREQVEAFASRVGVGCLVRSDSGLFYPDKDVNDYLRRVKGFVRGAAAEPARQAAQEPVRAARPAKAEKNGKGAGKGRGVRPGAA